VLTDRVADSPIGEGLIYVAVGVLTAGALTASQWAAGSYPPGTLSSTHVALAATVPLYPWLVRRFNVAAGTAYRGLGTMVTAAEPRATELEYRLTTLPALPTFLGGAAVVAFTVFRIAAYPDTLASIHVANSPMSLVVVIPILAAFAFGAIALLAKIGYQAWLIHRITTDEIAVNLLHTGPLSAFSNLTAKMSISLVAIGLVVYLSNPAYVQDPIGLVSLLIGLGLAAFVFIWPVSGVHSELAAEKAVQRARVNERVEQVTAALHHAIEERDLAAMDPLNKAIASLEIEARLLERVPTWPWEAETLRWVAGALMFPIVLYLIQLLIARLAV
jgi:hypothetical protein